MIQLAPSAPVPPAPPAAPKSPQAAAGPAAPAPINATCPVLLGNPVDPQYTTVYQGKVVGFCCPMCKAKFEKDPEKYAKNLP
jgi:YHS domain-containing protein